MERLTKKERVGIIAFSIIVAVGIIANLLMKNLPEQYIVDGENKQAEIADFERQIMELESDTAKTKAEKRKNRVKPKTVYKDINPLEEKMKRK